MAFLLGKSLSANKGKWQILCVGREIRAEREKSNGVNERACKAMTSKHMTSKDMTSKNMTSKDVTSKY